MNILGDVLCPPIRRSYKGKVLEHYPNSVPGNSFDHDSVCMVRIFIFYFFFTFFAYGYNKVIFNIHFEISFKIDSALFV